MNIITRNMNDMKNIVITIVANIWNIKDTREIGYKRAIPSHTL